MGCRFCNNTGVEGMKTCHDCAGAGWIRSNPEPLLVRTSRCGTCRGTGLITDDGSGWRVIALQHGWMPPQDENLVRLHRTVRGKP